MACALVSVFEGRLGRFPVEGSQSMTTFRFTLSRACARETTDARPAPAPPPCRSRWPVGSPNQRSTPFNHEEYVGV